VNQIRAFSNELSMIKTANMPTPMAGQVQTMAPPPPTGLGMIRPKQPKKGGVLSKTPSAYAKVHSVPTPSPMAGQQPVSAPPVVKS